MKLSLILKLVIGMKIKIIMKYIFFFIEIVIISLIILSIGKI